jgi:hypothetical protein
MKYLVILFVIWAGLSYPIYRFLPHWVVVVYGVVSLVAVLLWAGTRKGSTVKR